MSVRYRRDLQAGRFQDWHRRTVVLWREDDAGVPDRETPDRAFERIRGLPRTPALEVREEGDSLWCLHPGGWVLGYTSGLGFVGIVIYHEEIQ